MRLFIAAFADERTRRRLIELARGFALPGYRRTPAERLHVTLRFLGHRRPSELARLRELLTGGGIEPPRAIETSVTGICALPSPQRPRVLAYRLDSGAVLERLAGAVNRALAAEFGPPDKPFHAHLTFARLAPRARPVRALPKLREPLTARFDAFGLYESDTRAEGAVYRRVFALGMPDDDPSEPNGGTGPHCG